LDDLFGLSEYETAWSGLGGYLKEYEGESRAYERDPDIAGMEKLGTDYSKIAEEYSIVEIELQKGAKALSTMKGILEKAESKLKELENIRTQNEKLGRKEAELQARLRNIQDNNASTLHETGNIDSAIGNFRKRLSVFEAQAESHYADLKTMNIDTEQSFDGLKRTIAALDDKIVELRGEQEADRGTLKAEKERLSSLAQQSVCPLCSQNLSSEYKTALVDRIQEENGKRQDKMNELGLKISELQKQRGRAATSLTALQGLLPRMEDLKTRIKDETDRFNELNEELEQRRVQEVKVTTDLREVQEEIGRFDVSSLEAAKNQKEQTFRDYCSLELDFRTKENQKKDLLRRLDEIKERIDSAQHKIERMHKIKRALEIISALRDAYRSIQPKLRSEFVTVLRNFVQQVLDTLVSGEGSFMNVTIDENYTPYVVSETGVERDVTNLSGGERTLVAFAYRLGLGQLIMQSRTGHGLSMLLLDEPTESLGSEDGSIERLAEAVSKFKAIEQAIAVTHSDAFAEKAEHVVRLEKEAGMSKISVEK